MDEIMRITVKLEEGFCICRKLGAGVKNGRHGGRNYTGSRMASAVLFPEMIAPSMEALQR